LIRDGAVLATQLDDILDQLGEVGAKMGLEPTDDADAPPVRPTGLDETERALIDALSEGSMTLDDLARQTRIDSGKVAASMTMLVLKGMVTQQAGNVFIRKR
jgi:predicted Rossmann fold nucleotide-binding protein DprA/Smf involved in DNA uptake